MRVVVDFDKCQSNALCMAEAPEVCPTQAITIED
jgi:ferredoxin